MGIGSTPKGLPQQHTQYLLKLREAAEGARKLAEEANARINGLQRQVQRQQTVDQNKGGSADSGEIWITTSAVYSETMAAGQVVYLDNGMAYPLHNALDEAVLNLVAVILQGGGASNTADVLLCGRIQNGTYALTPGRVFLDSVGMPSSIDSPAGHYVLLGHSDGGDDFFFCPRNRALRSSTDPLLFQTLVNGEPRAAPLDATLTALAGLTILANSLVFGLGDDEFAVQAFAANQFPARSSTGPLGAKPITDFGLSLVDDADASTARATLGLVIGTDVQAFDQTLQALSAENWVLNAVPVGTGADTLAQLALGTNTVLGRSSTGDVAAMPVTDFAFTLLDDTTQGDARTTLGLGTGDSPTFAAITTTGGATIGGNTSISGNLTVSGTLVTFDTDNTVIEDPLIKLAKDNTANVLDIGFYGQYQPAATPLYAGLFLDASDGTWKLFGGLEDEPGTTVDINATGYAPSPLEIGDLLATGATFSGAIDMDGNTIGGLPASVSNGQAVRHEQLTALASVYQPLNASLTQIAGLADPNADRILFWDDSAGSYAYLTATNGLAISGTSLSISNTITAAGPIGAAGTVPVITYNARGQLTAVTTATITPAAIGADATGSAAAAQAFAIQRANHTGTQLAATISDFDAAASAASPVQSFNGRTGAVTPQQADYDTWFLTSAEGAAAFDAIGSAAAAEANANSYTDSEISGLSSVYDALGSAAAALSDANDYTDAAITGLGLGTMSVQDADAVAITGGTVSGLDALSTVGNVTVGANTGTTRNLNLTSASGQAASFNFLNTNLTRWVVQKTGADDLIVRAHNDDGTIRDIVATFKRGAGQDIALARPLTLGGNAISGVTTLNTTGAVTAGDGTGAASFVADGAAGQTRSVRYRTGGLERWAFGIPNSSTEPGADAGGYIALFAYTDAGGYIDRPIVFNRAAGTDIDLFRPLDMQGNTLKGLPASSANGEAVRHEQLTGLSSVYQPLDSDLTAIASLTTTTFGRGFLTLADAAAGRTKLSLGTAATQSSGAFDAAGSAAAAQAASQPASAPLSQLAGLGDPNADRLIFWDDSAGEFKYLTAGTGLSISGTTISSSAGISDGDKGDITVSSSGTVWAIDARAVTAAKMTVSDFTNLADNPTFELGDVGWNNHNSSIVNDPTNARNGDWCLAITGSHNINNGNIVQVTPGEQYYLSAWGKFAAGSSGSTRLRARWLDSSGTNTGASNGTQITDATTSYTLMSLDATVPAGAAYMQINFNGGGFVSGTAYIDDVLVSRRIDSHLIQTGAVSTQKLGGDITTAGKALLDDANAEAQLVTLGIEKSPRLIASGNINTSGDTTITLPAGTWRHLVLKISGLYAGSSFSPWIRFNSDSTATNYSYGQWVAHAGGQDNYTRHGESGISLFDRTNLISSASVMSAYITLVEPNRSSISKTGFIRSVGSNSSTHFQCDGSFAWRGGLGISAINLLLRSATGTGPTGSTVNASGGTYQLIGELE